jgi:hypothetical protein
MNFKEFIYNETSTASLDLVGYNCRQIEPDTDPHFGQVHVSGPSEEDMSAEVFVKRYIENIIEEKDYYEFIKEYGDDPYEKNQSLTTERQQWMVKAANFLNKKGYRMLFCGDKPEKIYGENCYAVYIDKTKIINITRRDYYPMTDEIDEITEETIITWKIPYNPILVNIKTLPTKLPKPIPLIRPRRRSDRNGDHEFL